jgi:adenosine/AMP kinase
MSTPLNVRTAVRRPAVRIRPSPGTLVAPAGLWYNAQDSIPRAIHQSHEKEASDMELKLVTIEKPDEINFILGQSHFIKTVEDLHEALVTAVPGIQFGLAFCESSGPALVRYSGTDAEMIELAKKNALALSAGHSFIIFLRNVYPINVLNAVKMVPEVCRIFCATANPVQVVIAETEQGRGILGVIDGVKTKGIEGDEDIAWRKQLLRKIGYKLG